MAPAMGKAQPARAMSVPVMVAAPGTGSRVEKSTPARKSAASWLSEMTGDIACPCVTHPPRSSPQTGRYCAS